MSNSTEGNSKLIGELREEKYLAKVSVVLIVAIPIEAC